MKERAVKEWPDLWIRRDESVDEYFEDPWKIWGAAENDDTPYDLTSTRRYVPQQRVNALVEALVDRLRDEARHAEQRSSAHRSHDEHMGAEEASGRAAAFSTSADLLAAIANYKEGEGA